MKYAGTTLAPATADSLKNLLVDLLGAGFIILQCPAGNAANVNFGTKASQPAFILPGGSAEIRLSNLKDVYIKGNGTDTLIVMVL